MALLMPALLQSLETPKAQLGQRFSVKFLLIHLRLLRRCNTPLRVTLSANSLLASALPDKFYFTDEFSTRDAQQTILRSSLRAIRDARRGTIRDVAGDNFAAGHAAQELLGMRPGGRAAG
jgi:hypothetical protein